MTDAAIRDEALAAWDRGWHPVPMGAEKHPCVPWKAFQTTQPTRHQVQHWFCPDSRLARWGLIHGAAAGTLCLDFDSKPALTGGLGLLLHDLIDEFGDLPITPTIVTPGGGAHMLFAHPDAGSGGATRIPTRKNLRPGFDVRGDGGFSAGPGSPGPPGMPPYSWLDHPDHTPIAVLPEPWLTFITEDYVYRGAASPQPVAGIGATGNVHPGGDIVWEDRPGPFGSVLAVVVDGRESHAVRVISRTCQQLEQRYGRPPTYDDLCRVAHGQFAATTDLSRPITTWAFTDRVRTILAKHKKR